MHELGKGMALGKRWSEPYMESSARMGACSCSGEESLAQITARSNSGKMQRLEIYSLEMYQSTLAKVRESVIQVLYRRAFNFTQGGEVEVKLTSAASQLQES